MRGVPADLAARESALRHFVGRNIRSVVPPIGLVRERAPERRSGAPDPAEVALHRLPVRPGLLAREKGSSERVGRGWEGSVFHEKAPIGRRGPKPFPKLYLSAPYSAASPCFWELTHGVSPRRRRSSSIASAAERRWSSSRRISAEEGASIARSRSAARWARARSAGCGRTSSPTRCVLAAGTPPPCSDGPPEGPRLGGVRPGDRSSGEGSRSGDTRGILRGRVPTAPWKWAEGPHSMLTSERM